MIKMSERIINIFNHEKLIIKICHKQRGKCHQSSWIENKFRQNKNIFSNWDQYQGLREDHHWMIQCIYILSYISALEEKVLILPLPLNNTYLL